jgi:hypothetical protein
MHSSLLHLLRHVAVLSLVLSAWPTVASSEPQRIYRCGSAYTNQPDPAVNCKPIEGGHVTVIEGTRVQGPQPASPSVGGSGAGVAKVDNADQRQRDMQAQAVLQAELQRAKQQQAELQREWNNGQPERRADEHRQPQKYQERVAQLRGALQRIEADVAGLQRELSRLPVSTSNGTKP